MNPRPRRCERRALPTELAPHSIQERMAGSKKPMADGVGLMAKTQTTFRAPDRLIRGVRPGEIAMAQWPRKENGEEDRRTVAGPIAKDYTQARHQPLPALTPDPKILSVAQWPLKA